MVRFTLIIAFCLLVVYALTKAAGPYAMEALMLALGFPGLLLIGFSVFTILAALFMLFTRKTV